MLIPKFERMFLVFRSTWLAMVGWQLSPPTSHWNDMRYLGKHLNGFVSIWGQEIWSVFFDHLGSSIDKLHDQYPSLSRIHVDYAQFRMYTCYISLCDPDRTLWVSGFAPLNLDVCQLVQAYSFPNRFASANSCSFEVAIDQCDFSTFQLIRLETTWHWGKVIS